MAEEKDNSEDGSSMEFGSTPDIPELQDRLDSYMDRVGLRSTGKRRLIIQHFFEARAHISLDELLSAVNQENPSIGYATVYRTMKMLVEGGIAEEHRFSDGVTRYEPAVHDSHHDHLICVECGRIQEFEEPLIEQLQARIAERLGFELVDHKHELYGICSNHTKDAPKA